MVEFDPVMVGIIAVLLGIIFFFYLMLRRTILGFREGMDEGKGGR